MITTTMKISLFVLAGMTREGAVHNGPWNQSITIVASSTNSNSVRVILLVNGGVAMAIVTVIIKTAELLLLLLMSAWRQVKTKDMFVAMDVLLVAGQQIHHMPIVEGAMTIGWQLLSAWRQTKTKDLNIVNSTKLKVRVGLAVVVNGVGTLSVHQFLAAVLGYLESKSQQVILGLDK